MVWVSHVLHRAQELGYAQIALTHTVYGRPRHPVDVAATALPASLWQSTTKQQQQPSSSGTAGVVQVLRRLHIVVETLSDTGLYSASRTTSSNDTTTTNQQQPPSVLSAIHALLQDYDLVSLQLRNDACFQAACRSANPVFDIVTLDSGVKIRAGDLQALWKNFVAMEVGYAPAVAAMNTTTTSTTTTRRRWVQACRALHNCASSLPSSPTAFTGLLLSSGPVPGTTSPLLLLRSAPDMVNVSTTVCGWKERVARAANTTMGARVWERAQQRRSSVVGVSNHRANVRVQSVTLVDEDDELWTATRDKKRQKKVDPTPAATTIRHPESDKVQATAAVLPPDKPAASSGDVNDDDGNDGFIAL